MVTSSDDQSLRDRLTRQEAILHQVARDVTELRRRLIGDGGSDAHSIALRLDRVEQSQRLAKRWGWALGLTVLGLFAEWLRRMVGGSSGG